MFISTKIRPEPYSVEPSLKNSNGEAFNGAVWIAGCKQLDDQSFQRMVSKLPAETLLIIDPKEQENLEKVGTAPSDLDHQAIRVIDESDNLEQIIYNHIHKLTTSEENWSVWRNKATEARREFVHGF